MHPGVRGKIVEQLRLIGEVHRLVGGTVAQAEHVVQLAHRLADAGRAHERSVVDRGVVVAGAAHDDELRRRPLRDLYETIISPVALHRHVESRTEAFDQPQLVEQRRELARHVLPLDPVGVAENARAFVFGKRARGNNSAAATARCLDLPT